MKRIRILANTLTATGPVRRGDVIEVDDALAEHYGNNGLADDAGGAELTRGVPQTQDAEGRWVPDQAEIDRRAASAPVTTAGGMPAITRASFGGQGPTVTEPTSGPMTAATGPGAPPVPEAPQATPAVTAPVPAEQPVLSATPAAEQAPAPGEQPAAPAPAPAENPPAA